MLYPHTCAWCGVTTEPDIIIVPPTACIYCPSCNRLVTYSNVDSLPSVDQIKRAIFDLLGRDTEKALALFPAGQKFTRRDFWREYKKLFVSYYKT